MFTPFLAPAALLLASIIFPIVALSQATTEAGMTIQTSLPTILLPSSCSSTCLIAGASCLECETVTSLVVATSSEGVMSILPITTGSLSPTLALGPPSTTMSSGAASTSSSLSSSASSSALTTTSRPAQLSASPGGPQSTGDSSSVIVQTQLAVLAVMLGFAWTLL
ncbi:hypothetical protein GQ43DRAFT_483563 [Delitschia confertaspora ATCC 74209]|uniref:Uncharacterized protein n=1 Tax=Delitschia confertaspora ATCC 74209 TaxID=1513339 RepID=A0A9P4JEV6_9PLEO|nr:hypothetical protein GQ43DRAFT_483563 [Delitschia confertaspora ATCC 74209]